jgi:hypothetical protein
LAHCPRFDANLEAHSIVYPVMTIRRNRPLLIAVIVVAALVLGPGLTVWLRHSLGEARATVTAARAALRRERAQLGSARYRLGEAISELTLVTAQRTEAQAELERIQGDLRAVQTELDVTSVTIRLQGPQAELLGRCLDGVTAALNQSAVVDGGAGLTLAAVATTCEQARAAIPGGPPP